MSSLPSKVSSVWIFCNVITSRNPPSSSVMNCFENYIDVELRLFRQGSREFLLILIYWPIEIGHEKFQNNHDFKRLWTWTKLASLSVIQLTKLFTQVWSSVEISAGGKWMFFDLQTKRKKNVKSVSSLCSYSALSFKTNKNNE